MFGFLRFAQIFSQMEENIGLTVMKIECIHDLQSYCCQVFRVEDSLRLYTLHGHSGGVSALFLDKVNSAALWSFDRTFDT